MNQYILGLTGGTGCGKSVATAYLKKHGAHIIDADAISRQIMAPNKPALAAVAKAFDGVLLPDGSLNRKQLAAIVFCDSDARQRLNSITFTYIIREIETKLNNSAASLTVIDAPLLFEAGLDKLCTDCLCIMADTETRKKRIIERDGLIEEEAMARINAQPDNEFYTSRCRFVIENTGSTAALHTALDVVLKEIDL